jgi:rhamnosyl/mannosyltransferase
MPENVETTDLLPITDYQILLHQAQFVVLPLVSIPHSAGDSHLVQSMTASKAVIASRTPSPETYIKHGTTGLLVSPGNVNELRKAIKYLWENPQEAVRMGREGRRRYEENYTFEKFAQRVERLLLEVSHG